MFGFDSNDGSFASFCLILVTVPLFPVSSCGNKKDKMLEINSYLPLSCVMGGLQAKIKAPHAFETPSVRQVGYSGSLNSFQFITSEDLWGNIFILSHIAPKLAK